MNVNVEYCDPFDGRPENFWMKVEHCGRYLWAADRLEQAGCRRVADVACADGYGSRLLARKLERVWGVDRNELYLAAARAAGAADRADYLCCDLDRSPLPFPAAGLDAIVCFETLEHLEAPSSLLREFCRVLRSHGLLLLSVPNPRYELTDADGKNLDPFHKHIFAAEEVLQLLRGAGFSVRETLGQDIPNRAVSRLSSLTAPEKQAAEALWPHSADSVLRLSRVLGYPDKTAPGESYSHIYLCQKDD